MRSVVLESAKAVCRGLAPAVVAAVLVTGGCALPHRGPSMVTLEGPTVGLGAFTDFSGWERAKGTSGERVLYSPEIRTDWAWDELIVSWNVEPAEGAGLSVEAQPLGDTGATRFYRLGNWSLGAGGPVLRTSLRDEADAGGTVNTDTLALRAPARGVRLRLTLTAELARRPQRLRWVTVSLCDTRERPEPRPPRQEAWGIDLDVPERSQVSYENGRSWCSPASVSMVLGWWARELGRPNLDRDVPEVAAGVYDPGWEGTGNWPFNMAYAGSLPGMRACVARLRDLRDVEDLVAAGIPVVLSVHAPALRGRELAPGGGHLVLGTGFTATGDVVVNDPWARIELGQRVRRVYARANVERAWEHAHRLVYLVAPVECVGSLPIQKW